MTKHLRSGQVGILLTLIIFLLISITTTAVAIALSSSQSLTTTELSEQALASAQAGLDNAVLRLLRDPSYSGEANLSIGQGSVTIIVSAATPQLVTSSAVVGGIVRRVRASVTTSAGQLVVGDYEEY